MFIHSWERGSLVIRVTDVTIPEWINGKTREPKDFSFCDAAILSALCAANAQGQPNSRNNSFSLSGSAVTFGLGFDQ
jgi:hypothetical protein